MTDLLVPHTLVPAMADRIEALTAERDDAQAKLAQAVVVLEPLIAFALDHMYEADIQSREAVEKDIVAARAFLAKLQPEGGTDDKA